MNRFLPRRLAAESLESRTLLAGDVTAAVDGGVLRLTGDAAANGVRIRQDGDHLVVAGTLVGGATTTINGNASFTASGITNGLVATLGGGNDSLRIANDDGPVNIAGNIVVSTGEGADQVSGRISNRDSAVFHLGPGADKIGLHASTLGNLVINGDPLSSSSGVGDQVSLTGVHATGPTIVRTGGGNDVVEISGKSSFPLSLTVATGDGADRVEIKGTTAAPVWSANALTIDTGRGNDVVQLSDVTVKGVLTIVNLDGASDIELNHVKATDGLFAWLGAGDDDLTIRNSSSARAAFGGGAGSDTLTLEGNAFARLNHLSF